MNVEPRSVVNNVSELERILKCYDPDIIIITETWLRDNRSDEVIRDNCDIFQKDRYLK